MLVTDGFHMAGHVTVHMTSHMTVTGRVLNGQLAMHATTGRVPGPANFTSRFDFKPIFFNYLIFSVHFQFIFFSGGGTFATTFNSISRSP